MISIFIIAFSVIAGAFFLMEVHRRVVKNEDRRKLKKAAREWDGEKP